MQFRRTSFCSFAQKGPLPCPDSDPFFCISYGRIPFFSSHALIVRQRGLEGVHVKRGEGHKMLRFVFDPPVFGLRAAHEEAAAGAAVTAVMPAEGAFFEPAEPRVFTADEPFSFYIYTTCNDTTAILFAGEIVE